MSKRTLDNVEETQQRSSMPIIDDDEELYHVEYKHAYHKKRKMQAARIALGFKPSIDQDLDFLPELSSDDDEEEAEGGGDIGTFLFLVVVPNNLDSIRFVCTSSESTMLAKARHIIIGFGVTKSGRHASSAVTNIVSGGSPIRDFRRRRRRAKEYHQATTAAVATTETAVSV